MYCFSITEEAGTSECSAEAISDAHEEVHEVDMEETEASSSQQDPDSVEKSSDYTCIFCQKKRKKYNGREQQLQTCLTADGVDNLLIIANEIGDEQLANRITKFSTRNELILYHKICKLNFTNTQQAQKKSNMEKTEWHVTRDIYKSAFEEVCSFICENIIKKKKCYFLSFLESLFATSIINLDPTKSLQVDSYRFENRLLKKYGKEISIVTMNGKKIVKTYSGVLIKTDLDILEEEDILNRAVLILRKYIRNIKPKRLPEDLTTDILINGECDIPQELISFYSKIISSKYPAKISKNVARTAKSFSEDLIYAATNGNIKTSKHITLGMAIKSLTNSKKIVNILHKYGHCCSYSTLEGLETEATFSATRRSVLCPEDIIPENNLCTGLAFNNFDRFVDTCTGKDTLHDTVGIMFQNIVDSSPSVPTPIENLLQNEPSTSARRRRRTFDEVTFELQPYNKKPKIRETLTPGDDSLISYDVDIKQLHLIDVAWTMSHFLKLPNIPAWVGYNSMIYQDNSVKQKISYLTTINASPTNISVVLETMRQAQQIAEECQEEFMEVTYDLAIAKVALQIQSTEKPKFNNLFVHLGSFHVMMAYFKAVGKLIDNCGITNIMENADILASGSISSFITAKHFNRCKRLHPLLYLALDNLHFESFVEQCNVELPNEIKDYLLKFSTEQSTNPTITDDELISLFDRYEQYKKQTLNGEHGKTPQFYMIYMNLISHYFMLCRSIRTGNIELFKYILPKISNLFFTFNQPNYARYTVMYHDKLMKVHETHPGLYLRLQRGSFGVKRTDKQFSRQPVDLTLEQTINADAANKLTGISHTTNSIKARQRWCKSHSIRSKIIAHIMEESGLRPDQDITADLEQSRIKKHSLQLEQCLNHIKQNMNPFAKDVDKDLLYNISTGQAVTPEIEDFLLNVETIGNEQREQFIRECSTDEERFEKVIKRNKIQNFATVAPKQKISIAGKRIAIQMQRDLFGQLFSLSLEQTLNIDKVLAYPLTPVPLALCHIDGTICKTDKSVLLKVLQKEIDSNPPERCDVIIYDGFFNIHSIKDVPSSFGNVSKKLMQVFTNNNADTVIIAFDRYVFPSIKDNEHSLRSRVQGQRFQINGPDQVRPSNFSDALKNIYFKEALIDFLIEDWANDHMAPYIGNKIIFVNYLECHKYEVHQGKVQRTSEPLLACPGHEEADTKIIFHVCQLTSDAHVTIRCSDTDILIIMLGNMKYIKSNLNISMHVGTGNNQKFINVTKLYDTLGPNLSSALPGFHAFTGCDFNSAFYRKGKKKPLQILRNSPKYIQALTDISNIPNCNLDELLVTLEGYVCRLYALTAVEDINVARVVTFTKAYGTHDDSNPLNLETRIDGALFPPCKIELQQHILRTAYIAHLWSHAHLPVPTELSPTEYGWEESNKKYLFKWFVGDQLPPTITSISNLDTNASGINKFILSFSFL